jgi:transposase-like protein
MQPNSEKRKKSLPEEIMNDKKKPDTEVLAKPKRRTFTAAYKRRIVEEAAACEHGEVAALLRRERLYSSHLAKWRTQFAEGGVKALSSKRGPKPRDRSAAEIDKLRKTNARLQKKLEQAELIIEVQKKVSALFAIGTSEED